MLSSDAPATLELLLEKNQILLNQYYSSEFIQHTSNYAILTEKNREAFLSLIQTISNYFQKTVLLRSALTDNLCYYSYALEHLKEEFCHNEQLMIIRNNTPPTWDPILEATSSWFAWKMFTTNDEEKLVLIHMILEASANVFFNTVQKVLKKNDVILSYFEIHSEVDEKHESMGLELLKGLTTKHYEKLLEIQSQGWSVFMAACDRIATLMSAKTTQSSLAALVI